MTKSNISAVEYGYINILYYYSDVNILAVQKFFNHLKNLYYNCPEIKITSQLIYSNPVVYIISHHLTSSVWP